LKRLLALCGLSIALYVLVFGAVVDRPLSLGMLRLEILQKTARLKAMPSPKLVILAGSNGPYSHSCVIIGAMLNLPCENAGIAVGIGLDELFLRYAPYLHRGDILYLPMETEQYTMSRAQNRAGADAGMLLRHDRWLLAKLPTARVLGALFCCNLADLLESAAEMPIAAARLIDPAALLAREYNAQGDRIDTPLNHADKALLAMPARPAATAAAITHGDGARLIARFVATETARGVIVIGGLPTDFQDVQLPAASIAAIAQIYRTNGGSFVMLANHSEYPRADFFDSEDHLAAPFQAIHSAAIGRLLISALHLATPAAVKARVASLPAP
jgi:hypothetical protein